MIREDGIMVDNGRFGYIPENYMTFEKKHLIILPKYSKLSEHIIIETHKAHQHIGTEATCRLLRTKCWIPGHRRTIRQIQSNVLYKPANTRI